MLFVCYVKGFGFFCFLYVEIGFFFVDFWLFGDCVLGVLFVVGLKWDIGIDLEGKRNSIVVD